MKSLDNIAEDLFNKIRGRFPSITIGNQDGKVTTDPLTARFFDFDYKEAGRSIGKVSISISEDKLSVMYSNSFVEAEDSMTRQNWYNFLKELRTFAKKRLLQFDTRDITKSNLDKRDYKFLAQQQGGEQTMSESKLYGTSRISYQDVGNARLSIRHNQSVNQEVASSRTQHIDRIYVESTEGERFMYPFRHLNGARAMARHVAEGGKPFDDFGKHITGLSEELANLKKFKSYMGRSSVMAESLADYVDVVKERIQTVKKTVEGLQKESYYKESFNSFETPVMEDVPADVVENWIEQLTIKQFNEDLKDVFPYVYKLVGEATKARELTAEDMLGENDDIEAAVKSALGMTTKPKARPKDLGSTKPAESYVVKPGDTIWSIAKRFADSNYDGDTKEGAKDILELNGIKDPKSLKPGQKLEIGYFMGGMKSGATRGLPPGGFANYEADLDKMMGQFSDKEETPPTPKKPETPITEFILSLYDRETGEFPKGETAVLTAVEKDYGEQFINSAKAFIERVQETYDSYQMEAHPQQMDTDGKLVCKDCGDELDHPTTNCPHDSHDPSGDNWVKVDVDGDGDSDIEIRSTQEENDIKRLAGL
jgi:LysM repeat protein